MDDSSVTPDAADPPATDAPDLVGDMASLQVLMSEHASLVSARSLAYNEAFTRAGMFLQALGMSFVGLSLLGAALGFSRDVLVIAMIVVAFDVLIGIATFTRVANTAREDLWAMQAMNRIRQGYVRIAPRSAAFLTASTSDDIPGVMASYGYTDTSASSALGDVVYGMSTSLGLVGMVLALLAGVLASLVVLGVGGLTLVAVIVGVVATLVTFALCASWAVRSAYASQAALRVRFPAPAIEPRQDG